MKLLGILLMLFVLPVAAAEEMDSWLQRMLPALKTTSYRGVIVYSRGDEVSSLGVVHRYRDGQVRERLVPQDGRAGEILRDGHEVRCVLPLPGRFFLNTVFPVAPSREDAAALQSSVYAPKTAWYHVTRLPDDRVAAHASVVIELSPRDTWRYGYRLWFEQQSALLIKSQVMDAKGQVLERFQFSSLELTDAIADSELEGRMKNAPLASKPVMEEASPLNVFPGWLPPGFVSNSELSHEQTYSDGLASFSVFITPAGLKVMPAGASQIGATTAYLAGVRMNGVPYQVTVVGEIPPLTAMKVAESVRVGTVSADMRAGAP